MGKTVKNINIQWWNLIEYTFKHLTYFFSIFSPILPMWSFRGQRRWQNLILESILNFPALGIYKCCITNTNLNETRHINLFLRIEVFSGFYREGLSFSFRIIAEKAKKDFSKCEKFSGEWANYWSLIYLQKPNSYGGRVVWSGIVRSSIPQRVQIRNFVLVWINKIKYFLPFPKKNPQNPSPQKAKS